MNFYLYHWNLENQISDGTNFFILKESVSFKIKKAPRGPHRPGDGGTGRTGTE